jgi:radical SAM superfamily enzyme YgiQ (UPF0313 family)
MDEFSSFVPMGLFNVLKSLRDAGYQAVVYNLSHHHPQQLADSFLKTDAAAILISAFFGSHNEAYMLANLAKTVLPGIPVVLGGPLSLLGREILKRVKAIDFVMQGEGEESAIKLLDFLLLNQGETASIPGLFFRAASGIKSNPPLLLADIDRYFFMPSEVLPHCHDVRPENLAVLISSRGCPYRCSFCSSTAIWRNRLRHHDPILLIEYLADLRRTTGALYFSLRDENFLASRKHVHTFTKKLLDSDLHFLWNAQGSAHLVDDELALLLADAGCDQLQIGIETVTPRLLRLLCKKIDPEVVRQAAKTLRSQLIRPFGYFIYGMDETDGEAEENIRFMKNSGLLDSVASTLVLYPGTELARQTDPAAFFSSAEMVLYHPESRKKFQRKYEMALAHVAKYGSFEPKELFKKNTPPNCITALAQHYHYTHQGQNKEAEQVLQDYSKKVPANPWPLVTLADFYAETGNSSRAAALRSKAEKLVHLCERG